MGARVVIGDESSGCVTPDDAGSTYTSLPDIFLSVSLFSSCVGGSFTPSEDGVDTCLCPVCGALWLLDTSLSPSFPPPLVWFGGFLYPALSAITIRLRVLAGVLMSILP